MSTNRLTLAQTAASYGITFVAMAVLDGTWLGLVARDFYKREMGSLMADPVRIWPAALFYLAYPAGLVFLVLMRVPDGLGDAVLRCAVFGVVAYGVYDMTTLSVLRGWSVQLSLVDLAWGTFASAVAGGVAYWFVSGRAAA